MNRTQFIEAVSGKSELGISETRAVVDSVFATIVEEISNGGKVQLTGFGTFYAKVHKERVFRNPIKGTKQTLPPKMAPGFRASGKLRSTIEKA